MTINPEGTIVRPALLGDLAAEQIRIRILQGELSPGSRLSQEALAREFGISRTPLRDALRSLERDGLIEMDGSGIATVAKVGAEEAADLLRIREVIDAVAAQRAASLPARDRENLTATLQGLVTEMTRATAANDCYRFRIADGQFHVAILRRCGSTQLAQCGRFVNVTALSMYSVRIATKQHLVDSAQQHDRIRTAICNGDRHRSIELAQEHVRHAYRYYYMDHEE